MLPVRVQHDAIRIGPHFRVSFQRTLRIPDDGRLYPLPPGLGRFPGLPRRRLRGDGSRQLAPARRRVIPMYQREALWLSFECPRWRACAVKVGVGKVDAVSGAAWDQGLHDDPQDYLVCPDQPWLDGINAGAGFIRQFVAMPLGMGYTVEASSPAVRSTAGSSSSRSKPRPGRFPDRRRRASRTSTTSATAQRRPPRRDGIAAGGRMRQQIHPDPHGLDTWDPTRSGRVFVHIVNSMAFRGIHRAGAAGHAGQRPDLHPARAPVFDLYDEGRGDLPASLALAGVKGVREMDEGLGFGPQQDDGPVAVPAGQVTVLGEPGLVADGQW